MAPTEHDDEPDDGADDIRQTRHDGLRWILATAHVRVSSTSIIAIRLTSWFGTSSVNFPVNTSAGDDVDGEAAARGLLVLRLHVGAGLAHRLDGGIQRHAVIAVA